MPSGLTETIETANNRNAEAGTRDILAPDAERPDNFLDLTRLIDSQSVDYYQTDLMRQWEKNYRSFNNVFPPGSKYLSDEFRHRSKIFRPKTRTAIRKNEARVARAFFATQDVVSIQADNDSDPAQQASAEFWHEMMNIRLSRSAKKGIHWFPILVGAVQSAEVTGIISSKQYWDYRLRPTGHQKETIVDPLTGEERVVSTPTFETVADRPVIELIPPENLRIHRGSDWLDPIGTTPFIQYLIPMFVDDVKARFKQIDPKTGSPKWKEASDEVLLSSSRFEYHGTRQAREGQRRRDSKERGSQIDRYDLVWVYENIAVINGEDWHWLTVGVDHMLTDPIPLKKAYPGHEGERPFVMGSMLIEAFKLYPAGKPELTESIQLAANELQNLRFDNVKYAMMGRPKVKRGKNVDLNSLSRHVPGKPIFVQQMDDLEWDRPPDVTASSFNEQDRLNVDFDDMAGTFSQGSVATNRKLNETVGGMQMMNQGANEIGDLDLRVVSETWVEPALRQILKLEQHFESDTALMVKAGQKAQLVQKYGINELTDEILNADLTMSVSVGIGATDPNRKLDKFVVATKVVTEMLVATMGPEAAGMKLEIGEIIKEIYGLSGYRDGKRFYNLGEGDEDPRVQMLMQKLKQAGEALEKMKEGGDLKLAIARETAQANLQREGMGNQADVERQRMSNAADIERQRMADTADIRQTEMTNMVKMIIAEMTGGQKIDHLLLDRATEPVEPTGPSSPVNG